MKIRTGFVTNSSSSSYISISITSGKLAEILKKYEELANHFDYCDFSGEECNFDGMDLCEYTPSKLDDVMDTLIEFLNETTDCCFDEDDEISDDDEPLLQMMKELREQKTELLASIKEVDWRCENSGWGCDSDIRMYENYYSKETLERIYAVIAKEKGCSVDEVTSEDFAGYARGRIGTRIEHFTYSRAKGGKGEYTELYELTGY